MIVFDLHLKIAKKAIFRVGSFAISYMSLFEEKEGAFFLKKAKHFTNFLIFNIFATLYIIIADEIDINCKFTSFESFV